MKKTRVQFHHPANGGILALLGEPERLSRSVSVAKDFQECSPGEVADLYYRLGTHPDRVEFLWI